MIPYARTLLLAAAALALTAQAPPPAIDDAGAAAITDAVHAMLTDMLADFAPPPDALHATVQGDHYHIEIPIAHRWAGGSIGGDSVGADLIPLGDGRWRIANGAMPARVEFDADHPPAGMPAATALTIRENGFSGVIDTTLATESRLEFHAADEDSSTEGAQLGSGMHMDRLAGSMTLSQAVDGRTTLASTSEIDGLRVTSVVGKQATTSETRAGTSSLRITNLSLPDLRAGIHAIATLLPLARAQTPGTPPDPALREQLHTLVAALADGATSLSMDQSQDRITMHGVGPVQGSIAHLGFGMDLGGTGDGTLALALRIQLDKPVFPAIPAGIMTEFLPSHLLLKPRLSGIDAAALRRTLDAAVDDPNPSGGWASPWRCSTPTPPRSASTTSPWTAAPPTSPATARSPSRAPATPGAPARCA
jgi:hypothetical protein